MAVTYEYVVETLDWYDGCGDDPDIIDTSGYDSLDEAMSFAKQHEEPWRICLRRDMGNDLEGITERDYAYPDKSGRLSGCFESGAGLQDGPAIPARFLNVVFPMDNRHV